MLCCRLSGNLVTYLLVQVNISNLFLLEMLVNLIWKVQTSRDLLNLQFNLSTKKIYVRSRTTTSNTHHGIRDTFIFAIELLKITQTSQCFYLRNIRLLSKRIVSVTNTCQMVINLLLLNLWNDIHIINRCARLVIIIIEWYQIRTDIRV